MKEKFAQMNEKELTEKVAEMRIDLIKVRSELASKAAANKVGQIHKLKKNIARALTVRKMKQREQTLKSLKTTEE